MNIRAVLLAFAVALMCATGSHAATYSNDFSSGIGAGSIAGNAALSGGELQLTTNLISQYGTLLLDDLDPGLAIDSFTMTFDLKIDGFGLGGADGFSVNFADPATFASGYQSYENGTGTNGLQFRFITYTVNSTVISVNGGGLAGSPSFTSAVMTDGSKQPVTISYNRRDGASLTYRSHTISVSAAQLASAGFTGPQAGFQFYFAARTGGGTEVLTLDDVAVKTAFIQYVAPDSPSPTPPYSSWATAAHDIQSAVDVSTAGDLVLVSNGVYATGGRVHVGAMTNRVVIDKAITVLSVNGPEATTILGAKDPVSTNGDAAVRCVYVGANAIISGFTLAGGASRSRGEPDYERYGGGVWCESSALVTNCILTGNSAQLGAGGAFDGTLNNCVLVGNSADQGSGGGTYGSTLNDCLVSSNSAIVGGGSCAATANRCIFSGNSAMLGGGKANGTMNNCLVVGNTASQIGGGATSVGMYNCTVTGNSAPVGGGVSSVLTYNCIVYFNSPSNFASATMTTSCTMPDPGGTGNITHDPQFVASNDYRLVANSPCADVGENNYAPAGVDLEGKTRIINDVVDLGAYELPPQSIAVLGTNGMLIASGDATPALDDGTDFGVVNLVTLGPVTQTYAITNSGGGVLTLGAASLTGSNTADFVVLEMPASIGPGRSSNLVVRCLPMDLGPRNATLGFTNNSPANPAYTFALAAFATNSPATRYAWTNSPSPTPPFTSWETAAHVLQDAVDWAYVGDRVIVTNGVYANGGRAIHGAMTNRVAINKVIRVESVNGPAVTTIQGAGPSGDAAVRCAYLKGGASLAGFTLSGGATRTTGATDTEQSGGGLFASSFNAAVSNCVFTGNSAASGGGGAYGFDVRFNDCTFAGNSATYGGGSYDRSGCWFSNCTYSANSASQYGGGAFSGTHHDNTFIENSAVERGGGTYAGYCNRCRLIGNSTTAFNSYGGGTAFGNLDGCLVVSNRSHMASGAYNGTLQNCTLVENASSWDYGCTFRSTIHNCIVYGNTVRFGSYPNVYVDNYPFGGGGSVDYSCFTPLLGGAGNISNDPMLDASNGYRPTAGSPCRDTGNSGYAPPGTDLDGNPRRVNFTVDMGAYEFQSGPPPDYDGDGMPNWWESQKGLSAVVSNGAGANADSDWMPDFDEWVADTDPNNAASYFPPIALTNAPPGEMALVINPTSSNRVYSVAAATNLLDMPQDWMPVAAEQTGTAGAIIFTITNDVPRHFYHTGVRLP